MTFNSWNSLDKRYMYPAQLRDQPAIHATSNGQQNDCCASIVLKCIPRNPYCLQSISNTAWKTLSSDCSDLKSMTMYEQYIKIKHNLPIVLISNRWKCTKNTQISVYCSLYRKMLENRNDNINERHCLYSGNELYNMLNVQYQYESGWLCISLLSSKRT